MKHFACLCFVLIAHTARAQQEARSAPAPSNEPAVRAAYGVVPGRRDFNADNPERYVREPGYPPGVFAVSIADRPELLAFDINSNIAAVCTRTAPETFKLPNGNIDYARFRCPGGSAWSLEVVFVDATEFAPTRATVLEWTALAGPSLLSRPESATGEDLHDYAAIARPSLLGGQLLVSAAWFEGRYLPEPEYDELRGDFIAFGRYRLLDRTLFIGDSLQEPSEFHYEAREGVEVREGIEWAFLPRNASEKISVDFTAMYEVPSGYLVRVSSQRDHEGAGVDESTFFYDWRPGQWRLLARAERVQMY